MREINEFVRRINGLKLFAGLVAIYFCTVPATVLIGRHAERRADLDWTPVLIAVPVAAAGFLACLALRAAASRRYVETSIRRGRPGRSAAFAYTLVAWLLAGTAGGLAGGMLVVAATVDNPREGTYQDYLAGYSLPGQFVTAGVAVLGTAGYYSWRFRRRNEIAPLEKEGVVRLVQPPQRLPKAQAIKLRSLMWLRGAVIEGLFFAGVLVPRLIEGERPTEQELVRGVVMVVGGPAIISFVLLVAMLLLRPTQRSAFDALRQPSSLAAFGLVLVALAMGAAGEQKVSAVVLLAGFLTAAATCLNIMDRGSQPWLGFVYLASSYLFGYVSAPDGSTAMPSGTASWVVAVLAAAYTVREARSHWRAWTTLVSPADVDVATPAP